MISKTIKTILSNIFCKLIHAPVLAVLFLGQSAWAAPRSPLPPYPEAAPLASESFDADYFAGWTNGDLFISGFGVLDESWSGYAMQRSGASVTPFIVPALNASGYTNITSDTGGALRWWVNPFWSSGATNGEPLTLLEMDAASGAGSASMALN
jgi:hypothetical protein